MKNYLIEVLIDIDAENEEIAKDAITDLLSQDYSDEDVTVRITSLDVIEETE